MSLLAKEDYEDDAESKDGEGEWRKQVNGAGDKGKDKKTGEVMSDIQLPHIKVIISLLTLYSTDQRLEQSIGEEPP